MISSSKGKPVDKCSNSFKLNTNIASLISYILIVNI